MFTFSPIEQRLDLLSTTCAPRRVDGEPLRDDPVVRQRIAQLATDAEVARVLGLRVVAAVDEGREPGSRRRRPSRRSTSCSRPSSRSGSRTPRWTSADPARQLRVQHRGRPDGGPRRVDLPLHRDRHHRRRRARRSRRTSSPAARSASPRTSDRDAASALLDGITVLDLSSVGPAARTSRWLADYGADGREGRRRRPSRRRADRPALLRLRRRTAACSACSLDLKADDGRGAFLRLAETRRRRHRELPSRRGRPARHRLRRRARRATRAIVYCSTSGYGQDGPALAVGRPRPQLPRRRRLPRLHRARRRRRPAAARVPRSPTARAAACTRSMAILAALVRRERDRRGRVPRRVGRRRRARADVALRRRVPRDRRRSRRPRHDLLTGRYACYDIYAARRRRLALGRRHRAAVLGATCAALLGLRAVDRAPDRRRACRTRSAPTSRAAFAHQRPRRVGRRARRRADTCVAPVLTVPELVDDEQFARARRDRRRDAPGRRARSARSARCSPGMAAPVDRRTSARRDRDRHRRAARRRRLLRRRASRRAAARRSDRMSDRDRADDVAALIGEPQYEEAGEFPVERGYIWTSLRVGRERQPAVLGRRRRRRDHRRPDRAADDALGLVPAAPLGARAHRAGSCRCRCTST